MKSKQGPAQIISTAFALFFTFTIPLFSETITAGVAANVQFAIEELNQAFQKETGHQVKNVIGSSGKLTAQISNGAPYNIFLAANMKYPNSLIAGGHTIGSPKVYAKGVLVLWTNKEYDMSKGFSILGSSSPSRIALANPANAPYGVQTIAALKKEGIYSRFEKNLVYGESLSQVNRYVVSRSVDFGFTAKSVVLSPKMKGQGKWVDVPAGSYTPIEQGVVLINKGTAGEKAAAKAYMDFLFSKKAREIFTQFGYNVP